MLRDRTDDELRFLRRVLIVAAVVLFLLLLWAARQALLIAFAAILVAVLLDACADAVARRTGIARRWALLASGLGIVALLAITGWLVGSQVAAQVSQLARILPDAAVAVERRFGIELPDNAGAALPSGLLGYVAGFGRALLDAGTALLFAVVGGSFLAAHPEIYRTGAVKLFPKGEGERVIDTLDTLGTALRRFLLATFISMGIIGMAAGLATWWIGLPAPLALGLFAGITQFVPVLGPVIGAIPAVLVAAAMGGELLLWTIAAFLLIQQVESNMITPLIEQRLVNIPPFVLLVGIVTAGAVLGLGGVALAAPITVVAFVAIQKLWVRQTLERQVEIAGDDE